VAYMSIEIAPGSGSCRDGAALVPDPLGGPPQIEEGCLQLRRCRNHVKITVAGNSANAAPSYQTAEDELVGVAPPDPNDPAWSPEEGLSAALQPDGSWVSTVDVFVGCDRTGYLSLHLVTEGPVWDPQQHADALVSMRCGGCDE
jgi:hypothetical protein